MSNETSAVEFEGAARVHMGIAVSELDRSVAFYSLLLGGTPTKTRPGYAKFEVATPAVNLSLNVTDSPVATSAPGHYGIQVKSNAPIEAAAARLAAAGHSVTWEREEECCYAVQNKIWTSDPDGNAWEVFVVLDDMRQDEGKSDADADAECCGPTG